MNNVFKLLTHSITYEAFLNMLSQYTIGFEIYVSYLEYEVNKDVYEKAIKEGYILNKINVNDATYCSFLIKRLPKKYIDEELINSYFF